MQQSEYKAWLSGIVSSVEELEMSYKQRIDLMNIEYQKDINDLLNAYKAEKQQLNEQIEKMQEALDNAKSQLAEALRQFKTERVAHRITRDKLLNIQAQDQNSELM